MSQKVSQNQRFEIKAFAVIYLGLAIWALFSPFVIKFADVLGQSLTRPRNNSRCNSDQRKTKGRRHYCGCGNRGPNCDAD